MRYLSTAEALFIASEVTGVPAVTLARISRLDLLESALNAPSSSFEGQDFYPDIFDKAAVLGSRIVRNHPLQDGNKRHAWTAVVIFLDFNNYELEVPTDEAVEMILELAAKNISEPQFSAWLRDRAVPS